MAAVLVWWHFVGANTADDGYILTMARVSEHAGYMANYYRWFGTPEAPFGWYYDLLALWAHVVHRQRLGAAAHAADGAWRCWWIISREVIPRLGTAVKKSRPAAWTAAAMFLAFWLPLNNGLRPEPIIARRHPADLVLGGARRGHQPAAAGGGGHHHRGADAVLRPHRYRRASGRCWSPSAR